MEQRKELMTAKETAHFLGVSRTTLWRKSRDGALPSPLYIAGLTRWRKSELFAFLDAASTDRMGANP